MHLSLPLVDYLVVVFYLILMLAIGFYFSRFMKAVKIFLSAATRFPGGWPACRSI